MTLTFHGSFSGTENEVRGADIAVRCGDGAGAGRGRRELMLNAKIKTEVFIQCI